ncbi:Y-family DNA polymerase [Denitrobaculum tricleocarpae]|uniref:Y-family DNA polymerase n=1 Tax=Denitrobaculum tricleocarpae TaxID=2591009 RepID=UPI0015D3C6D5|nr:DNA polymerase Y family protein [Denitrobaculum tricleocarpae]
MIRRQSNPQGNAWWDKALAVTAETGNRVVISAVTRAAELAGIAPGMALADARAVLPDLFTLPADERADAAMMERLARWCGAYTPWVSLDGPDGLWLDVTGCAHLRGGEEALLNDLLERLSGYGFSVRGALADTPGGAWAFARCGEDRQVIPSGGTRAALAPLPVAALRLESETLSKLSRLGLRRIGDLYGLSRISLANRFRLDVVRRLDQALGSAAEPITPRAHERPYRVRMAFPEPLVQADDIAEALKRLLQKLCARLRQAQYGCRRLEFQCHRVDGDTQRLEIGTARPLRDPKQLARLFAEHLSQLDAAFGFEALVLSASGVEPLGALQEAIPVGTPEGDASGGAAGENGTAPLIDLLGNRLGFERIQRLQPVASYLPERAYRSVSAAQSDALSDITSDATSDADAAIAPHGAGAPWPARLLRPARLLKMPEAVETLSLLPPGEPGTPPALFVWRRVRHKVRAAEGPERLSPEWWRRDPAWSKGARDYWRVEDEAGRRFWLYREGPLRSGVPVTWFLHGLFA